MFFLRAPLRLARNASRREGAAHRREGRGNDLVERAGRVGRDASTGAQEVGRVT
jgi:hypothetical protein